MKIKFSLLDFIENISGNNCQRQWRHPSECIKSVVEIFGNLLVSFRHLPEFIETISEISGNVTLHHSFHIVNGRSVLFQKFLQFVCNRVLD